MIPKLLVQHPKTRAPFVDATGLHAGALLGDVRHDPYQSGGVETPPTSWSKLARSTERTPGCYILMKSLCWVSRHKIIC